MRRVALFGHYATRAGTPGTAHPCPVRKTLPKVVQERFPRCGSDRRSRNQGEHALCADQVPRSARSASDAPGSGSAGAASHGTDQRDSRISAGTWHHLRGPPHPPAQQPSFPGVIEDAEQNLSPRLRWLLDRLWQEWKQIESDVQAISQEVERVSDEDVRCRQLRQIPGFGPLVSTATVAAIGNGAAFRRGRDFVAWVGVVPRQYSTGGKQKLLGISKRGNIYLRRMLIHGARAALLRVKYDTGGFGQWVHRLAQRAPHNKVVVAIANKLARMARAVLSSGKDYRHQPLQPAAA